MFSVQWVISLTPNFSWVYARSTPLLNRFNGLPHWESPTPLTDKMETAKAVTSSARPSRTQLKLGVNEKVHEKVVGLPPKSSRNHKVSVVLIWLLSSSICLAGSKNSGALSDTRLASIGFEQKLNAQVPLDLNYRDENNQVVELGDYLHQKPAILVLGYYGCPMLCTLVLNGLTESMEELKWTAGRDFEVINVSIATNETPTLAAAKKAVYLKRYGRGNASGGWHFLTGDAVTTKRLADVVGFQYERDTTTGQYAHPSGLIILTPEGRVSKYLFGVTYPPRELFEALQQARAKNIGSRIQELVLLCFHYRPITGKYGVVVMRLVRIVAVLTLSLLAVLIVHLSRSERRSQRPTALQTVKPRPQSARRL